jgi:hypothetical protein
LFSPDEVAGGGLVFALFGFVAGYRHLWQLLMDALRITAAEAKRLERQASLLCPKVGITGQVIEPRLPAEQPVSVTGAA